MSGGASTLALPEAESEELTKEQLRKELEREAQKRYLIPDMSGQIENLHKKKASPTSTPAPVPEAAPKPGDKMASFFDKKKEEEDEDGKPVPPTPVYGGH